jgi:hypothetical protein
MDINSDAQDEEGFYAALLREDAVGAVIRAQIYVEHELIEFVKSRVAAPEIFQRADFQFNRLVRLSVALGLSDRFVRPLNALAKIRNDFAHKLGTKLDDRRVSEFLEAFSFEMLQEAKSGINRMHFPDGGGPTYERLNTRGRFDFHAFYLWAMLTAETRRVEQQKNSA